MYAALALGVLVYVVVFVVMSRSVAPHSKHFVSAGSAKPLYVYVDLVSINPTREEAQLRLWFADDAGAHGVHYSGPPDRDIALRLSDADTERIVVFRAHQPMPPVDFSADLTGSENYYPLDRYKTIFYVSAFEGTRLDNGRAIPLNVTTWEGLNDWNTDTRRDLATVDGVLLGVDLARPSPIVFFAAVTYTAMALLGVSALTVGVLVFLGKRRVEVSLMSALGAMIFAIPALRNVLPGAPPFGVPADLLIFLWAEVAVVTGLSLFVWTWARRGTD